MRYGGKEMLLGEDVKIRAGEKRIYYEGGTSPIGGGDVSRRVI